MIDRTEQALQRLKEMVTKAKSVPMSASCMINRSELMALVDEALEGLSDDFQEAQRVTSTSLETLERAQQEARQIVAAAEERARYLASQGPVQEEAQRQAVVVQQKALADAEALRREADAYVDARIASFEAGLLKTMAQVRTMRDRLARRSSLDQDAVQDDATHTLPRVEG
jgi:predicted deacylase